MATVVTADHYLAGMVGLGLLRTWYLDGDVNAERMRELTETLQRSDEFPFSMVLDPTERDLQAGYEEWAPSYDGPNPMIETEERVAHPILRALAEPGRCALDAACGTGRQASLLHSLGCTTVGVDRSEAMIAVAREKLPEVRFEIGDVEHVPFDDESFDGAFLVTTLGEIPDQGAAVAELARVIKPGGRLVVGELMGDRHWVPPGAIEQHGEAAGLILERRIGSWVGIFSLLRKPD